MKWSDCFSDHRMGSSKSREIPRTEYLRDFDRLIFASSFRRLQNKTQVFPLPGSTFVHNRLTHSLEVASVGRTLGKIVGDHLADDQEIKEVSEAIGFYKFDLSNVIASACLAHDIGNPAFGHSGEKAISNYFIANEQIHINNAPLRSYFSDGQWLDLVNFEGNANALRVLTHAYRDKPKGGMGLTFSTLAAIVKYPCEAAAMDASLKHRKKYGFFQTERDTFLEIAGHMDMIRESKEPIAFKRHPFVYLVEAADDICYRIIDMEDAHRLGIVTKDLVSEAFLNIIRSLDRPEDDMGRIQDTFSKIKDANDSIAYLRAKSINALTLQSADTFIDNKASILAGVFGETLIDYIEHSCGALADVIEVSVNHIYNHHSVVEIEITGYHVMSHLLNLFVPAVLRKSPAGTDRMALRLMPLQFREHELTDCPYTKVMSVVDFISGMTDAYATEFYRKTTGIDISKHS